MTQRIFPAMSNTFFALRTFSPLNPNHSFDEKVRLELALFALQEHRIPPEIPGIHLPLLQLVY